MLPPQPGEVPAGRRIRGVGRYSTGHAGRDEHATAGRPLHTARPPNGQRCRGGRARAPCGDRSRRNARAAWPSICECEIAAFGAASPPGASCLLVAAVRATNRSVVESPLLGASGWPSRFAICGSRATGPGLRQSVRSREARFPTRPQSNRLSCSAPRIGGWKCSVVRLAVSTLRPSRSQAASKRRPTIQAYGPEPVIRLPQVES
jgi:hypothetical protein